MSCLLCRRLLAGADKVAVEKFRGCKQSNPWALSPPSQRLMMPWGVDKEPLTWQGCRAAFDAVCSGLLPDDETLGLISHQTLEPKQYCKYCKTVPFATPSDKRAQRELHATMKSDQSRKGKSAYAAMRKKYSDTHGNQNEFQCNPLKGGMKLFVPDALHVYDINLGYQFCMHVIWRVCDANARERVSQFHAGMGVKVETSKKSAGRNKWMKGSAWAAMCLGNKRFPGGLTAWLPSLAMMIGESMLESRVYATQHATGMLRLTYHAMPYHAMTFTVN